jgi:hypothetical protein
MAGVTGPRERLRDLAGKLLRLPEEREALHQQLGAASIKLVADGYRDERDPYGVAWSPLLHREGLILRDTGRMAQAWYFVTTATGIELRNDTVYAARQHYGDPSINLVARRQGPNAADGMPDRWGETFNKTADEWYRSYLK